MENKHVYTGNFVNSLSLSKILLITAVTLSSHCFSQTKPTDTLNFDFKEILLKERWLTDHILGLDSSISTYTFTKYVQKGKFAGNITQFSDSIYFHSSYTAWCGNDNFTHVRGTYRFSGKNKITISVNTVTFTGEWTKPTEHRKTNYFTFTIFMVGDTIELRKDDS